MTELHLQVDHRDDRGFQLQLDTVIELTGVTALFGPSGSGKTTLLDLIAGLRTDVTGAQIRFGEHQWQQGDTRIAAAERAVGYVFQDARLFPHLNVAGNLEYAERRAATHRFDRQRVTDWLELAPFLERRPDALSAGQKQRVAIARALLRGPELMLLDEPLANLDRSAADHVMSRLIEVVEHTRIPMIYVSHQIEEISNIADRIVVLENGKAVAQGPFLELAGRLDTRLADDESAAAILSVTVGHHEDRYGLTELDVDGRSLWVSATRVSGQQRRLRIPARDVSICVEQPQGTSILNVLPVTIDELRDTGSAHCLLRLRLEEQYILARITRRSRDELALDEGQSVFAQIKSTALLGDAGS